jgi:hypothetical protein
MKKMNSIFRREFVYNKNGRELKVVAAEYPPCKEFPNGDIFVSISQGGVNIGIEEYQLEDLIHALQKSLALFMLK